ncbi:bis(5'-nucleosyl)-tetraphosphatase (symmetrical) YqeK [Oscillatoria sp. FACHB-1406]|uniref:bis(5'-nucleosyl)-tetraphosphatase (symmetrical) YqeK n=1 Tax=Oscillatoria sp. FACHB-1406 TaxID=2692846 RepID=UPI0016893E53|nr:bis(5'-nucleosyl)-tetraphosphatase (symmetrical) YqeK [Oscillatoria sp. FACHB-1406]MBD2578187.1 bis(5'-nucleosyl)-tetraphosphatase (symmetrical) YqeK [Oscillatoria sp. FACHB-1406]
MKGELSDERRQEVIAWLRDRVPEARVRHILGVEQLAGELAQHHGLDVERAKIAGLMHDLAKYFPPRELLARAETAGIEIDSVCLANPHLLHADASAMVAREQFGIEDRAILEAIANHTLGRPEMSPLSCIIFVADAAEPSRGTSSALEILRRVSWENLYESVGRASDCSLQHLLERRYLIHPRTILTRNWAIARSQAVRKLRKKTD